MSVLGPVGREALEQVTCEPGADPVRSLHPKHVGLRAGQQRFQGSGAAGGAAIAYLGEAVKKCSSKPPRGVEFCVVIVAALIQKYARLLTTTYSTGASGVPRGYRGSGPMV